MNRKAAALTSIPIPKINLLIHFFLGEPGTSKYLKTPTARPG
jgi:hypothetical protein